MKIGVLTYHKANNYGAFLQSYALTNKLLNLGFDAEIINFNMKVAEEEYKVKNINPINNIIERKRHKMFLNEQNKLPLSKEELISDDIEKFNEYTKGKYDVIIVGSDEIWKIDSFRGFPNPYWLIRNDAKYKLSYAASSRSDLSSLDEENIKLIKQALEEFKLIGVRDSYTYNEVEKISKKSRNIMLCCDPVFLYDFKIDKEIGKKILKEKFRVTDKKKIMAIMVNDKNIAKAIYKKYNKKYTLISLFRQWNGYVKTPSLTPFEWINVIAASDILISNYFHGVCFAILSNTYFISVDSREKNVKNGKLFDLLNRNDSLSTFLSVKDENYVDKIINLCENKRKINFQQIIENERELGKKYFDKMRDVLNEK